MEEKSLQAVFKLLFLKWLADKGSHADPVKLFWKMAAGKLTESPFANSMAGLRSQLDAKLLSIGIREERWVTEAARQTSEGFALLRAWLAILKLNFWAPWLLTESRLEWMLSCLVQSQCTKRS